jgi:hypothetical protein
MTPARKHHGAIFDPTRIYRYVLWRTWDAARPTVAFVLLNPSTADARRDDPTIRRCANFARAWGFGGLEVVNLFAFRTTRPTDLKRAADPVGPRNDVHLHAAAHRAGALVFAWGNQGTLGERDRTVVRVLLAEKQTAFCLGRTTQAQPRHPLYVRADAPLVFFEGKTPCSA